MYKKNFKKTTTTATLQSAKIVLAKTSRSSHSLAPQNYSAIIVLDSTMSVYVRPLSSSQHYSGVKEVYVSPFELASYDIVLVTYETLKTEVYHATSHESQ